MLKVGLTGNIGSGKSTVSRIFMLLKIPVYHADDESKKFLLEENVIRDVAHYFGSGVLDNDRQVNRRSLAALVFSDKKANLQLNSILHPLVREDFRNWIKSFSGYPYIIQEAAIILESGFRDEFDYIIHVSCPTEIAIDRVMNRDHVDGQQVKQRLQFQIGDEEKGKLSDFVILNDGSHLLIPQVISIHNQLLKIGIQGSDQDTCDAIIP
ncbi:MAG: dephospho-CoA kinase [Bacteroidales bacterium]|jgi:dephospho-CoA kinase|nr:dephospho-CoA kinase [Bacteroidales bacterium]